MVFRYNPLNSRHMILAKLALISLTQLLYYKLEKFFLKVLHELGHTKGSVYESEIINHSVVSKSM